MDVNILHRPAYSVAEVSLAPGDAIRAESGAMVSMSPGVDMETSPRTQSGGILKGIARKLLTGESFFLNTFRTKVPGSVVRLAPANVGDMALVDLDGSMLIQSSCFLACDPGIELETKLGGFKSFFGGKGFFMLRATGKGPLLLSGFGALIEVNVTQPLIVDTGHIVAFEPTLDFSLRRVGGWFSTFFSGEGFVCSFTGSGKLFVQSRNPREFGSLVGPRLPPR